MVLEVEQLMVTSLTQERFASLREDLKKKQASYIELVQGILKSAESGSFLLLKVKEGLSIGSVVSVLSGMAETLQLRRGITIDFDEPGRTILIGPREG